MNDLLNIAITASIDAGLEILKVYFTDFDVTGSCNYAFIILFNEEYQNFAFRKKFENT